jgi:hypothetical protein
MCSAGPQGRAVKIGDRASVICSKSGNAAARANRSIVSCAVCEYLKEKAAHV